MDAAVTDKGKTMIIPKTGRNKHPIKTIPFPIEYPVFFLTKPRLFLKLKYLSRV